MKNLFTIVTEAYPKTEEIDWQDVYQQSLPRIFHFFCYKVGDETIAEELTSLTFEKAWVSRAHYRKGRGEVHAWLVGIARNVMADHFRKRSREIPVTDVPETDLSRSFDEDLQRKLDFEMILSSLARFPERERELIAMKYGAELTNREIARMTGLSESNVGTILHRVVEKLRTEWEQNHEG